MKHTLNVTFLIVALFLVTQVIGLSVINSYIDVEATQTTGETTYEQLPYSIERPNITPTAALVFIFIAVLIGTALVLLLIKFRKTSLWEAWFFLSVVLALSIAFSAFINEIIAFALALLLAAVKIFKPNIYIHNFTELFVYGGLAVLFVPILNVAFAFILLLLISAYDMFAVWKTKHMVKLAKFQTESKLFAGLLIPYKAPSAPKLKAKTKIQKVKTAILGGGDMAFPLIFAGVILQQTNFLTSLIIPATTSLALLYLLIKSQKGKFYPAMPFLTVGCVVGYLITLII